MVRGLCALPARVARRRRAGKGGGYVSTARSQPCAERSDPETPRPRYGESLKVHHHPRVLENTGSVGNIRPAAFACGTQGAASPGSVRRDAPQATASQLYRRGSPRRSGTRGARPRAALGPVLGWHPAGRGGDLGEQRRLAGSALLGGDRPGAVLPSPAVPVGRLARRSCRLGTGQPKPGDLRCSRPPRGGSPVRCAPLPPPAAPRLSPNAGRVRLTRGSLPLPPTRIKLVNLITDLSKHRHKAVAGAD